MIRIFNRGASSAEYARMKRLFSQVLTRVPREILNCMPVINVVVEPRPNNVVADIVATHNLPSVDAYLPTKKEPKRYVRRQDYVISHDIVLYTNILSRLSDFAVIYVMAHEIAHGWLDEIGLPHLDSNEDDADSLARKWGFGEGLAAFMKECKALKLKYGEF